MDLGIKGEIALVVGASEGIGYESAKALLEEGADLLICSRNPRSSNRRQRNCSRRPVVQCAGSPPT